MAIVTGHLIQASDIVNKLGNTPIAGTYTNVITRYSSVDLRSARGYLAATSIGNYALFGGGSGSTVVDAFNTSLTRSAPTSLSASRGSLAATSVGNYALFGGGYSSKKDVDAYNTSLTRSLPTKFTQGRADLAATSIGDYALFGGGDYSNWSPADDVDIYNTSLTHSILHLSSARYELAATTIGDYALFGGGDCAGQNDIGPDWLFSIVETFTASLTKSYAPSLYYARMALSAVTFNNHALFTPGIGGYANQDYIIDIYDTSLTHTVHKSFWGYSYPNAVSLGNFAIFGGASGFVGQEDAPLETFDTSLTHGIAESLYSGRVTYTAATSVGNYALIGGGYNGDNYVSTVTVYNNSFKLYNNNTLSVSSSGQVSGSLTFI